MLIAAAMLFGLSQVHPTPTAIPTDLKTIDMILGTGKTAVKGDRLTVEYTGNLLSGKVFDSSVGKPPFSFVIGQGQVIKGWDQGMDGMKVGGKRILSIPPELAYGDRDLGDIPPKSTLVFEVKLLRVDKQGVEPKIEIEDTKVGSGATAEMGSTVELHYTGTFVNGVKFDSSRDRNQTFTVTLGKTGLIKGFTQGVVGMKVGGTRKVTIPSELGYGPNDHGPIPGGSTLVFDLEVISIK